MMTNRNNIIITQYNFIFILFQMSLEYTHENLQMAVSAVKDGGLKILTASKTYGIPFGTLYRRVKGHVDSDRFNRGPRTALSEEVERGLKETILEFQKKGFGLTRKEVMELAAKTNAIQETSAFKSGQPSNRWFQRFMKRHGLSLRTQRIFQMQGCRCLPFLSEMNFFILIHHL